MKRNGLFVRLVRSAGLFALALLLVAPAARAEVIKIGAILAETGPAAFLGGPASRSLRMLADEINAAGGIKGHTIELIIKDSAGSPEKAISFAKQLIEEDRVFAIIGPSTSGESLSIKKVCEDGRTIMISCSAADLIVTPVSPHIFKTAPSDRFAARQIYTLMQKRGISRIAVLAANDGFGKAGKEQLEKLAPEFSIRLALSETYDSKATDLSALVAKMKANPAIQAVVNWSVAPAQAIIAKNMRQANWRVPLFQSHGFGNIRYAEAAGAAAEGIIFPCGLLLVAESLPDEHPQKALLMQYKTEYETLHKEQASAFGGYAYDALNMVAAAVRSAGTDRARVRDAVEGLKNFPGVGGVFSFSPEDHNGLDIDSFAMMTVKDGRFILYQEQ